MTPKEKIKYLENKNRYLEAKNEYQKNERFSLGKEEAITEEKVAIVCEMQRKYLLRILLKISCLKHSIYYYALSKTHKDMKNDEIMNIIINIFYIQALWLS